MTTWRYGPHSTHAATTTSAEKHKHQLLHSQQQQQSATSSSSFPQNSIFSLCLAFYRSLRISPRFASHQTINYYTTYYYQPHAITVGRVLLLLRARVCVRVTSKVTGRGNTQQQTSAKNNSSVCRSKTRSRQRIKRQQQHSSNNIYTTTAAAAAATYIAFTPAAVVGRRENHSPRMTEASAVAFVRPSSALSVCLSSSLTLSRFETTTATSFI